MLRHHANKEVREAATELVRRWKELVHSSGSTAARTAGEPSTPAAKRRRVNSVGSTRKELQQHNNETPKIEAVPKKPPLPTNYGAEGVPAGPITVAPIFQPMEKQSQSVQMRIPIGAMPFGPSAPIRRRPNGYFCYSYKKTGECSQGTAC